MASGKLTPGALYIDNWHDWLAAVTQPATVVDVLTIALCALLALGVARALARKRPVAATPTDDGAQAAEALAGRARPSVLLGERGYDGVLFPLLWLVLVVISRYILLYWQNTPLLRVTIPVLMALVLIRTGAKVLRAAFPGQPVVRTLERSISWMAWVALALWVSGVLPAVLEFLDTLTWKVGGTQMSMLTLLEGMLTAGALVLLAMWASSAVEVRLLQSATGTSLSVRKAIANVTRAFMLFVGLLVGLSAVGIDLTALSVFSGAVGVGIGFGLQKLTANYVSGFVVLAERSLRIGDVVRVGGFEGRISDIRARYTIIRSAGGIEAMVPNETMMTSTVENLTLTERRVSSSTTISVGYDSDAELVRRLLIESALECPRVLREPVPSALLTGFGADGLDFSLTYWIGDPENGLGSPRSQINIAVLEKMRAHGIDIPYPQRVVHTVPAPAAAPLVAPATNAGQGE
ncbi:MAG: mechanosensitive ion channel [Pseudomonadota bacterium]|nr:mechanosensitive ion channel [Pseudomonadota bacterium]